MADEDLGQKLASEIAVVTWEDLRPHAEDERLFLVAQSLQLIDAALALARDDTQRVSAWIEAGDIGRPTPEQLTAWAQGTQAFRFLILSPFVLAQLADDAAETTH